MRAGRLLLTILVLILSALLILIFFSGPILQFLASGLVVDHGIKKSDAVVVLGGSSPSRVLEAADIYRNGLASNIIITRGGKPEGKEFLESKKIEFPEEADLNILVLNKLGIESSNVYIIPGRVYGTLEEARAIKDFAQNKGLKSLIITTSKSHTRRCVIIFDNVFKNSGIEIFVAPTKYDSFEPAKLGKNKNHWKVVVLEYQKILYYYAAEIFQSSPPVPAEQ